MIWPHHWDSARAWADIWKQDPSCIAVIFAGSLTKGYGREDSDVDGFIVLEEEACQTRFAAGDYFWWDRDCCAYEGGYIDAKYITLREIREVAARGSEPSRSAFQGAVVLWSRDPDMEDLCRKADSFPDEGVETRIERFHAQMLFGQWFLGEAAKRGNLYLATAAASKVCLFAARMILASDRILYPYHKWVMKALSQAPSCPPALPGLIQNCLEARDQASADQVVECVLSAREWSLGDKAWPNWVREDSELNWIDHEAPIEDI